MPFRVERLTLGDEATESPLALQQTGELLFDQRHAVAQGCDIGVLAGLDGAFEAVDDVRKVEKNLGVRVANGLIPVAVQPSAEILEVRLLAQQLVLQGGHLVGPIVARGRLAANTALVACTYSVAGFPGRRRIGRRLFRPLRISRRSHCVVRRYRLRPVFRPRPVSVVAHLCPPAQHFLPALSPTARPARSTPPNGETGRRINPAGRRGLTSRLPPQWMTGR